MLKYVCQQPLAAMALSFGVLVAISFSGGVLHAQPDWVEFTDETSNWLSASPSVSTTDNAEKDYAWGDVDQDGDIDLVVVRKEDFTSSLTAGPASLYTNVLLMNINGVLTDQTTLYANSSDVAGDNGFLTATNDRDVILADVTGDGWLDMVTAPTLSDGFPKHISHPRVYRNLGMVGGSWGGFLHEDARIPALASNTPSGVPHAPRFCSVAAGDLDGDGDLDLYFGDYDSGGAQTLDFNDRLLVNNGSGFFTDGTGTSFTGSIVIGGSSFPFQQSAFGMAVALEDMNRDGHLDIVKDTALNPPQYVGVSYNSPGALGQFANHRQAATNLAPYHITVGDLNNDNLLDIVVTDDAADSYLLNTGNDGQGLANFSRLFFDFAGGIGATGDDGFGGNSVIADLDNDGFNDVILTDVDVDIAGCNRRLHIYHNLGNVPNVTLRQENDGANWRPNGVHDAAVFDINGDGYLDMVLGTCTGTEVWGNVAPGGVMIDFPQGLPETIACSTPTTVLVQVLGVGAGIPTPNGLDAFISYNGGLFQAAPTSNLGGDLYEVTLDGSLSSGSVRYYFSASEVGGGVAFSPEGAPGASHTAAIADSVVSDLQNFENGTAGWTVTNDPTLTTGAWELVDPIGTTAAPENDAGAGTDTHCWVTGQGSIGGTAGANDIDGGTTTLTSPVINLSGGNAQISMEIWHYNLENNPSEFDDLLVQIANDGTNWVTAITIPGGQISPNWSTYSFSAGDFVAPTATVQVRFVVGDDQLGSIVESGVDNFTVNRFLCGGQLYRGDTNGDGNQDISDAIALLQYLFNALPLGCEKAADTNDDGMLNIADTIRLLEVLFQNGAPLPAPSAGCGEDPTDDTLTCDDGGSCP